MVMHSMDHMLLEPPFSVKQRVRGCRQSIREEEFSDEKKMTTKREERPDSNTENKQQSYTK